MEATTQPEDKNVCIPDTRWNRYQLAKFNLRGTPRPQVFPIAGTDTADTFIRTIRTGGAASYTEKHARDIVKTGAKIRRLTPIECERLQGFPDNWTAEGIDGPISDTQRYKMCGNAVTTNVVQAVFERIFESTMEAEL